MGCSGSSVAPNKKHCSGSDMAPFPSESTARYKNKMRSYPKRSSTLTDECSACETASHSSSFVWKSSTSSFQAAAPSEVSAATEAAKARGRMHLRLWKIMRSSKDAGKPVQNKEADVMEVRSTQRAFGSIDSKHIRNIADLRGDMVACVGQPKVDGALRDGMAKEMSLMFAGQTCSEKGIPKTVNDNVQMCDDEGTEVDANDVASCAHDIAHTCKTSCSLDHTCSSLGRGNGVSNSFCDRVPACQRKMSSESNQQAYPDTGSILAHMHGQLELLQSQLDDLQSEAADLDSVALRSKAEAIRANKALPYKSGARRSPRLPAKFLIPSALISAKTEV